MHSWYRREFLRLLKEGNSHMILDNIKMYVNYRIINECMPEVTYNNLSPDLIVNIPIIGKDDSDSYVVVNEVLLNESLLASLYNIDIESSVLIMYCLIDDYYVYSDSIASVRLELTRVANREATKDEKTKALDSLIRLIKGMSYSKWVREDLYPVEDDESYIPVQLDNGYTFRVSVNFLYYIIGLPINQGHTILSQY